jgi:hypothetical protein
MKSERQSTSKAVPPKRKQNSAGRSSTPSVTAADNDQLVVKVDEDGRTHYAVPLKGPLHKEGQPYLIAHYSMPPPAERKVLVDKLAQILAEAVVKQMYEEADALHRAEPATNIWDSTREK